MQLLETLEEILQKFKFTSKLTFFFFRISGSELPRLVSIFYLPLQGSLIYERYWGMQIIKIYAVFNSLLLNIFLKIIVVFGFTGIYIMYCTELDLEERVLVSPNLPNTYKIIKMPS